MAGIHFFSGDLDFKLKNSRKLSRWIKESVEKEGSSILDLTYVFCSDRHLLKLNQAYLHHDTLTDIITFDYSEAGKPIAGEIYISIERVAENAVSFKVPFEDELRRVLIHGVLHILGYKDKKRSEIALMRKKEEASLSLWK